MKKIMKWKVLVGLTALCAMFSAFSPFGGHSFQVYLDNEIISEQYVHKDLSIPKITLDPSRNQSQLIVKYNECGRTVSGRKIYLKDGNGSLLKEWKFEGTTSGYKDAMTCSVKDVIAALKRSNSPAGLYYSSNDFEQGQQVATLVLQRASL